MATKYIPPETPLQTTLGRLLHGTGRTLPSSAKPRVVHFAGDRSLLRERAVSLIGARNVSDTGAARARALAVDLVKAGVVVMSGLAQGVDTEAVTAAIEAGGRTIGVIGTPLGKVYPVANARLQEHVYRDHLLVSQFAEGSQVRPANFPIRNKLMSALSDASVIVEASDGSGTLHQAAECVRLSRWLFIARSLIEDRALTWPAKFTSYARCVALDDASQIIVRVDRS